MITDKVAIKALIHNHPVQDDYRLALRPQNQKETNKKVNISTNQELFTVSIYELLEDVLSNLEKTLLTGKHVLKKAVYKSNITKLMFMRTTYKIEKAIFSNSIASH